MGLLLNAVHDEFLLAFKSLPVESQMLLNNHYEIQIPNGDSADVDIRIDSANSENGWKEIGPKQKVSNTRTVPQTIFDFLTQIAINRRNPYHKNIHWKFEVDTTKAGSQKFNYVGTLSTVAT